MYFLIESLPHFAAVDIVILLENDQYGEEGYGGDKYNSGLEKAGVSVVE